MKQLQRLLRPAWAAFALSLSLPVLAQGPAPRLSAAISGGPQTELAGSLNPRIKSAVDLGAVPSSQPVKGITLVFSRSAAQEADLQTLLAGQTNPASPLYHQWLTPEQFAARFGVADADISAVESWLGTQGFSIDSVSRGRTSIHFSGNAGQVAQAFGAPLHHYNVAGVTHIAPSRALSLPAALAPLVTTVLNLSDFHPRPAVHHVQPAYTSSKTGAHYLTPVDLATMYDVNPVYSAGFNGAGQSVAILGQSAIDTSDISRFQTAEGRAINLPTLVLVPGTGVSAINSIENGDELEADLDLEYASGMAPGAHFFFVYTGDDTNFSVLNSMMYAVDESIAPILNYSFGDCEANFSLSDANAFNEIGEQANSQGQTILASAGDTGSTDCALDAGESNLTPLQLGGLSTSLPASLPTVTAMGGTQMIAGASTAGSNTYWATASGSDVASSLLSYVPEVVWNEDDPNYGLSSGGGGSSVFFSRPTWQTGVVGIPSGTARLVPDLAVQASAGTPGFLVCTSDLSQLAIFGITSSCTAGFRDATTGILEANYGGTSFAAPIMAGLLAVLNQATASGGNTYPLAGQGNINPTLYALASNTTTYASAFHDITSGSNACVANTEYPENDTEVDCLGGSTGYTATAGYDEASGLGSIDFATLVAAWPVATSVVGSRVASTTTVTAASATVPLSTADLITITVASAATGATPTGSISLIANGGTPVTLPLTNGQVTFSLPGAAAPGSYVVEATYSGDGTYLPSSGTVSVTIGTIVSVGTFSLTAQNITIATNGATTQNVGSGTVVLTPGAGYTGAVNLSVVFPATSLSLCYELSATPVSTFAGGVSTGAQPITLYLGEGAATCSGGTDSPMFRHAGTSTLKSQAGNQPGTGSIPSTKRMPVYTAVAGLFLAVLAFGRRSRRLPTLLGMALLAVVGLGLSGCGGTTATPTQTITTPTTTSPQTLTVTVIGTDTVTSSITASTTLTLTVE